MTTVRDFGTIPSAGPRVERGRYVLTPPDGGSEVRLTRVTNFVSLWKGTYGLELWKQRLTARGFGEHPELLPARDADDATVDSAVAAAGRAAGVDDAARLGRVIHDVLSVADGGPSDGSCEEIGGTLRAACVDAYQSAMADVGLAVYPPCTEAVLYVPPPVSLAGRMDRVVVDGDGRMAVLDVKTGSMSRPDEWRSVAAQCAVYGMASHYWDAVSGGWLKMPPVSDVCAYVAHVVPDVAERTATARIVRVDMTGAAGVLAACQAVRAARSCRVSYELAARDSSDGGSLAQRIAVAGSFDELRMIHSDDEDYWTRAHSLLADARIVQLAKRSETGVDTD